MELSDETRAAFESWHTKGKLLARNFHAEVAAAAKRRTQQAELYCHLRSMHWNDGKLAVVRAKDLPLGTQTYSGDMLDEEIKRQSRL